MNFLIDFGVKSALALGVAFLGSRLIRQASASMRYALWTCALAAVLALPLILWTGPAWNIDRGTVPMVPPAQPAISVVVHAHRPAPAPVWPRNLPNIVWLAGVMAMLVRTSAGHWRVRSLFGKAEEIRDARWLALAAGLGAPIGLRLKRSTATDVPLSYGLIRATVLLPAESDSWSDERRRVVLSHEMIHARRLDSVVGVAGASVAGGELVQSSGVAGGEAISKRAGALLRRCGGDGRHGERPYTPRIWWTWRGRLRFRSRRSAWRKGSTWKDASTRCSTPRRARKPASRKLCAAMFTGALALMIPLAAVRAQSAPPVSICIAKRVCNWIVNVHSRRDRDRP